MTDEAKALVERLDAALRMDAATATDREWTELLAQVEDARSYIATLTARLARVEGERDQAVEALQYGERSLAVAIYGLPAMLEANALTDEEQMIPALQTAVEQMRATLASIKGAGHEVRKIVGGE